MFDYLLVWFLTSRIWKSFLRDVEILQNISVICVISSFVMDNKLGDTKAFGVLTNENRTAPIVGVYTLRVYFS